MFKAEKERTASSDNDRAKLSMFSCMEGKRGSEEHLFLSEPCLTWIMLRIDEREVQHLFSINHTQASEPANWSN